MVSSIHCPPLRCVQCSLPVSVSDVPPLTTSSAPSPSMSARSRLEGLFWTRGDGGYRKRAVAETVKKERIRLGCGIEQEVDRAVAIQIACQEHGLGPACVGQRRRRSTHTPVAGGTQHLERPIPMATPNLHRASDADGGIQVTVTVEVGDREIARSDADRFGDRGAERTVAVPWDDLQRRGEADVVEVEHCDVERRVAVDPRHVGAPQPIVA
jgi:hypothetical protein